ncbi:hypothetical protein AVEN_215263-1 [Araneus ventricosus]|uniref:Uncharacterized protein n=1 Tax=Araneus ventricosus TaxID=182803 RepID=A0A4Y2J9B4_ARAVE|nr:hypothetical protein AVEN_65818-1 [Araneus ventricosus]GBM86524.1 hypothetical protein AVEN_215263-1 [Araneus ventricosus]
MDHSGLVLRSVSGRRVPGSKLDSAEDPTSILHARSYIRDQTLCRWSGDEVWRGEGASSGDVLVIRQRFKITRPVRIFTNPTLIEPRQEISQYHWLRGAVTSFSALARNVR